MAEHGNPEMAAFKEDMTKQLSEAKEQIASLQEEQSNMLAQRCWAGTRAGKARSRWSSRSISRP
jgi:hypothetical protein